jgi:hypothetical protein
MAYTFVDYERDAERYCEAASLQWYRYRLGVTISPDLARLFDDYGFLFGTDLIEQLGEEPIGPNRRRALVAFAVQGRLDRATCEARLALAEQEAAASVVWEGEAVPWRAIPARLANLADPSRRHRLDEARRGVTAAQLPLRRASHLAARAVYEELGWRDPVARWDELLGLHLADLEAVAAAVLRQSQEGYFDLLLAALRLAGMESGDAWSVDLPWLARGAEHDSAFAGRELGATARRTLHWLGLRLEEQPWLALDLDRPPGTTLGSFCAALDVPHDVRVVLSREGGWGDYATLFTLLGRAEHLVNVDPAKPMPYRWLGNEVLGAGYAALLAGLIHDPVWLGEAVGLSDRADFLQRARLAWLVQLRRDAALVRYEPRRLRSHPDEWEELQALYAQELGEALGARHFEPDFLSDDSDQPLPAAQRLLGAVFGEQLRAYLVHELDEEWFRLPRAGRFLIELWREGSRYTAEELARFMGYAGYDATPLLERIAGTAGRG